MGNEVLHIEPSGGFEMRNDGVFRVRRTDGIAARMTCLLTGELVAIFMHILIRDPVRCPDHKAHRCQLNVEHLYLQRSVVAIIWARWLIDWQCDFESSTYSQRTF